MKTGKLHGPAEVLWKAIITAGCSSRRLAPGEIIKSLRPEMREVLKELKAEDIQVRIDAVLDLPRKKR